MTSEDGASRRRFAAHQGGRSSSSRRPKSQPAVLMERAVHIDDLKNLKFEGQSLYKVFTDRQWTRILQAKGKVYTDIVLEFYQQFSACSPSLRRRSSFSVRGVTFDFSPTTIASFLDLPVRGKNRRSASWSANEIYGALTNTKDHHKDEVLSQKDLVPFFQVLHLIVSTNVTPTAKMEELSIEQGKFLYDIVREVDINLPLHIFQIIRRSVNSFGSSIQELPFGLLITGLALKAGVQIKSNEKEQQLMKPIRWTRPISQTGPLAYHPILAQQAGTSSSSEDHLIRPPWFDAMLMEIDSRVAPIQRQLTDMEDRLQELRDLLIRDTLV